MDIAKSLKELWRKKRWLALVAVLAIVTAGGLYTRSKAVFFGTASTQILIDENRSPLVDANKDFAPLASLATVYSQFMTTGPVEEAIAKAAGVPPDSILASAPLLNADGSLGGAVGGGAATTPQPPPGTNAITFSANPNLPIVSVSTQSDTVPKALALANAAANGLSNYISTTESQENVPVAQRVRIVQVGTAVGGLAYSGPSKSMTAIAFLGVFIVGCVLILVISRVLRDLRSSADDQAEAAPRPYPVQGPFPAPQAHYAIAGNGEAGNHATGAHAATRPSQ